LSGDDLDREVSTVVIGEPRVLARGQTIAVVDLDVPVIAGLDGFDGGGAVLLAGPAIDPAQAPIGEATAAAGGYVLDAFRRALVLAQAGELDAICFAPCNKQAMHLGGLEFEDELRFFVHVLDHKG
jgi:4-hydroxy-L-threonine phosphate dehydrogenase PdxA